MLINPFIIIIFLPLHLSAGAFLKVKIKLGLICRQNTLPLVRETYRDIQCDLQKMFWETKTDLGFHANEASGIS